MTSTARNLTDLQRRRLSWRIANGMTLTDAAAPAGLDGDEAGKLLDDGHFPLLVEAYRALADLPEHARRRRLLQLAIAVIEQATMTFDMRVALFVMKQETLGRDSAEALTDGVIRALERREPQRRPPDDSSPSTQPSPETRPPSCPSDNAIYRAAASLRADVMEEFEMRSAAAMTGAFSRETAARNDDEGPRQAAPVEPAKATERAETEEDGRAGKAEVEKPCKSRAASPPTPIPPISSDRLTERQLQYLADLARLRSQSTGPPPETGPDNPNEP